MGATVFFESTSELATLSNTFKVTGTPTDPTAVTLTVTTPSGTATTYTWPTGANLLTHGTAGVFSQTVACSEDGDWEYVWEGTNAASDAIAGTWHVFPTSLGKLYATVDALKSRLRITTSTDDDYEIHMACFAASRAAEHYCQRHFWRTVNTTARTFIPSDYYCLQLPEFNDLVSITTLKTDAAGDGTFETTWTASDYQLRPLNPAAALEVKPYTEIRAIGTQLFPISYGGLARDDRVEITGVFGWPSVPYPIRQATLMTAGEIFKSKDTFQTQSGFEEFGPIVLRRNPMALDLLKPYRRNAVLVA